MARGLPFTLRLAVIALLCAAARAQYAVAFFGDQQSASDNMQSYVVSNDALTLEGMAVVRSSSTLNIGNISVTVRACGTGDIASEGGLDPSDCFPFSVSALTCLSFPCVVPVTSSAFNWCNQIGKAIIIESRKEPNKAPFYSVQAVLGFGNLTSIDCPYTKNPPTPSAIVKMTSVSSPVVGTIVFQLRGRALSVSGFFSGLQPAASCGIHVHDRGDVRDDKGALATGMHFMFTGQSHGLVNNTARHTGDLGNINADSNGVSAFNILVPLDMQPALTLLAEQGSAIGRSVILHYGTDDGYSQPAGNSGRRVAQGVVGYLTNATSSAVLRLLNPQEGGFACACILCGPAGAYSGYCFASDCNKPPPNCGGSTPPSVAPPTTNPAVSTAVIVAAVVAPLALIVVAVRAFSMCCSTLYQPCRLLQRAPSTIGAQGTDASAGGRVHQVFSQDESFSGATPEWAPCLRPSVVGSCALFGKCIFANPPHPTYCFYARS